MPAVPILIVLGLSLLACRPAPEGIETDYPVSRISERVYVIHGPNEMPNPKNRGFMNNPGFVVTTAGVVIVDPGSSVQVGEMVLKKLRSVTDQAVIAVFATHVHGDHWLGNQAIRKVFPQAVLYGHPRMVARAAKEGDNWVSLMDRLSHGATRGTRPLPPTHSVEGGTTLEFGDTRLRLYHIGTAHTDGDLVIEVVEDKTVFFGDVVVNERVGRMDDGSFQGNIALIDAVLKSPVQHVVPGHGRSGGRELALQFRAFQRALLASVKKHYEQGLSDFEMKDKVMKDLADYAHWTMFDTEIGKLVSLAYLQVEKESF